MNNDQNSYIDRERLHIFWMTSGISVKFSGKMWLMIISKATKNQSFNLSLEHAFLKKAQGDSQIDPLHPSPYISNLKIEKCK